MIRPLTALLGLATAACAGLSPVTAAICGNGVLDPGEDCDLPDQRCVACGWTCGSDADCASLPAPRVAAAYRCGVDRVCHAPSGAFATPSTPQPFDADRFVVTDVDRDGIGDAVGLSSTAISTRLGDPAGRLAEGVSTVTPDITGLAAVTDVDGDGSLDYVVPTSDGVVALSSLNHVMAPYALTVRLPALFANLRSLEVFAIDDHHIGALVNNQAVTSGGIIGVEIDLSRVPPTFSLLSLCENGLDAAGFDPARFQSYKTAAGVSVTFVANDSTGKQVLCALSVASHAGTITNTFSPAIPAPASSALADLTGSGCPSLVVATTDLGSLSDYAGSLAGDCTLSTSPAPLPAMSNVRPGTQLVGSVPLRPQPGGVEPDALVTSFGIIGVDVGLTGYAPPYYTSDRALTSVRSGDLDADGAFDVVASSQDADLDLLYRVAAPPGFLRIRLGTNAPPANIVVDDFDGDGVADVEFTARLPGLQGDPMDMVYGKRDRAPAVANVGQFDDVIAATPNRLIASNNPTNTIADLTVVDSRRDGAVVLDELYGSPQRALIPFVDPDRNHATTFLSVVAGRFISATNLDVVALDVPRTGAALANLRLLAGDGLGAIDLVMPSTTSALANAGSCASGAAGFCLDEARLVAWPSAGHDVVVAIDPVGGQAVVVDPTQLMPPGCGAMATPCSLEVVSGPLAPGSAISLPPFIADSDGDGVPELIFGAATPTGGSIEVCQVGSALACTDLVLQLPELGGGCAMAAPGRVGRDGATEIVVACGAEIYAISHDATGYHATPLVSLPAAPSVIGLGDVTGDSLDDLLVIEATSSVPQLVVYPQLTSRAAP